MTLFKTIVVVAATALFNVTLASTDFSSAVTFASVTSVEWITPITMIPGSMVTPSSKCETVTTVVYPTVTVTLASTEGAPTSVSSSIVPTTSVYVTPSLGSMSSASTSDLGTTTLTPIESPLPTTPALTQSWTIVTSLFNQTTTYGTANSTDMPSTMASPTMSVPYPLNSTTTVTTATGTGVVSASESASASYSTPAEFTAAACAVNMGTAALFGGVVMAFFGV